MAIVRDLFSGMAAATLLSRLMLVTGIAPVLAPSLGGLVLGGHRLARRVRRPGGRRVRARCGWPSLGLRETLPEHRRRTARPGAILATYRGLLRDRTFVALVLISGPGVRDAVLLHLRLVVRPAERLRPVLGRLRRRLRGELRRPGPRHAGQPDAWSPGSAPGGCCAAPSRSALAAVGGAAGRRAQPAPAAWPCCWSRCGSSSPRSGCVMPNTPALALTRHGESAGTAAAMLGCGAVRHRRGGGAAGRRVRRRQRRADGRGHDRRDCCSRASWCSSV